MSLTNPIQYLTLTIDEASQNPWTAGPAVLEALQAIKVSNLDFDHSTKLLIYLVQYCYKINSPVEVLELILSSWCADDDDVDGVIGDLASMIRVQNEVLKYVCRTCGQKSTLFGVLETVVENRKGCNIGFALTADRLIAAFDSDTPPELFNLWDGLLQAAIRTGKPKNGDAYMYIVSKLGQTSPPVPRPTWVNVHAGETLQLLRTTYKGQTPSSKIIDRIRHKIESQITASQRSSESQSQTALEDNADADEGNPNLSQMIQMYVSTSVPEELRLLDECSEISDPPLSLNFDSNLTGRPERLWGPVNAMLDRDCSGNEGPCRMLTCLCRDFDQACDEELSSGSLDNPDAWFTGTCDQCRRSVLNISYAIRFPVTGGGWVGCFCSWSCLRQDPPRPIFAEESAAIKRVKAVIEQFGILDRASAPR